MARLRSTATLLVLILSVVQAYDWNKDGENCPIPESIPHGTYTLGPEARNVTYGCVEGYDAVGETYADCLYGAWSLPPPPCVAPGCETLYALAEGYTRLSYGGAVAQFRCEEGNQLHGSSVLVCDGVNWNGTQPDCRANEKQYGDGMAGYKSNLATGHHSRHHRNHHKSNHELFLGESDYSCIEPATVISPPSIVNAIASTKWSVIDGIPRLYTIYRCKWGFVLAGESRNMYCQKGHWVGKKPKCVTQVPSTMRPSFLQGDDPNARLHTHEDWIRYADYTCFNSNNRVTAPDATHAQIVPRFKMIDGSPHLYVQYKCDRGYSRQEGDEHLYCKQEEWKGVLPDCRWDPNDSRNMLSCEVNNGGCQQSCNMDKEKVTCSCHLGYRLGYDGVSCHDINECETDNGGCEQLCFNKEGHFRCGCKAGYHLSDDGNSCLPTYHNTPGRARPPLVLFHA